MFGDKVKPAITKRETSSNPENIVIDGVSINPHEPTIAWQKLQGKVPKIELDPYNPDPPESNQLRIVCISDTHGSHRGIRHLPPGDILIHAGDITSTGKYNQLEDFDLWMKDLPYKHKIVIPGNHDITLEDGFYETEGKRWHPRTAEDSEKCKSLMRNSKNFTYLESASITVEGYKIYGSPHQPYYHGWAFNLHRGQECQQEWDKIPEDTEILVTHGPPLGFGDECKNMFSPKGERAGCANLLKTIREVVKPKLHVFGHIHEDIGMWSDEQTVYIQAATCDLRYKPINPVLFYDLPKKVDDDEDDDLAPPRSGI